MARPVEDRMKYGFYRLARPAGVRHGARVFATTREYRDWCAKNLPAYLGFQPAGTE
jgi:hypothetical protein